MGLFVVSTRVCIYRLPSYEVAIMCGNLNLEMDSPEAFMTPADTLLCMEAVTCYHVYITFVGLIRCDDVIMVPIIDLRMLYYELECVTHRPRTCDK